MEMTVNLAVIAAIGKKKVPNEIKTTIELGM